MSLLDDLYRNGALRTVDHALAQSLRRLAPDTSDEVLTAAALASLAVAHGHAAFDPACPQMLLDEVETLPAPQHWRQALSASRWVATPDAAETADPQAPLVLEGGLLYLRRYREYERRLAQGLLRIAARHPSAADAAAFASLFASLFAALFPPSPAGADDGGQARAATLALGRSLLLITGGPGTGKTRTIARLLLLLIAQAQQAGASAPRIALAAPTGRAAERMAESLRAAAASLRNAPGVATALCDALPLEARTLHRLLGTIPGSPRFRHDADNPLPYEVIVVDEASMVDLPLMCKLVEAVADGARLILLGDRDQLPSVEAGDVLAAIVDAADEGMQRGGLSGHRVQLRRGYRQSDAFDLAPLADAIRDGDSDDALALLRSASLRGVHFHETMLDPLASTTRESLLAPWRELATLADPGAALALAGRTRLLTALREGPQGASLLNDRIEEALAGARREPYFHGRLLLVTENSYRHGLFNGDIGVCLPGDDGAMVAWFAGGNGGARGFHPAALPAHSGAFAMTVHKSQGSEFDTVWLQLPGVDARVVSRELLYTAITRARRELHVCANEATLRQGLSRHAARVSGLAWRLGRQWSSPVRFEG
jgi:exodeoxyribonuclease V alpha subunit